MKRILLSGGAGFVGSHLALAFKSAFHDVEIIAFDNLKRRGSELAISRLKEGGVKFVHGDVRNRNDFDDLPACDFVLDCAAEPSVLAGVGGSPLYVIDTNLGGTVNLLEFARKSSSAFVFLSTSRVYPLEPLSTANLIEADTRFSLSKKQSLPGLSEHGVAENFSLDGSRSLYGASKLASELLIHEFVAAYGLPAVINRCGVISGAWQMGKIDQGVAVLWAAHHLFQKPLSYIGFGGKGKQVRDILHVNDLMRLLQLQIKQLDSLKGDIFNVGGGVTSSISLMEMTSLCQKMSGNSIEISSVKENRPNDIPLYITDNAKIQKRFGWTPKATPEGIFEEIFGWLREHGDQLRPILIGT